MQGRGHAETCEGAATPGDAWIGNGLAWHRVAMEWHSLATQGHGKAAERDAMTGNGMASLRMARS